MVRVLVDWPDRDDLEAAPLRFPATPCCNCGASEQLEIVTRLRLSLPYCPGCRATADRGSFWGAAIMGWIILTLMLFIVVARSLGVGARPAMGIVAVIAALPFVVAAIVRRRRGAQTASYQPVRYHWVRGLVFTSDRYAMLTVEANPGRMQIAGALATARVEGAGVGERLRARAKVVLRVLPFVLGFLACLVLIALLSWLSQ